MLCSDWLYGYHGDHVAGPDAVVHSHHAHVIRVLSSPQEVLVAHEVGAVVDHEAASLHPAGVTPAQVGRHVGTVAAAFVGTTLEVPVLIEHDLIGTETTSDLNNDNNKLLPDMIFSCNYCCYQVKTCNSRG